MVTPASIERILHELDEYFFHKAHDDATIPKESRCFDEAERRFFIAMCEFMSDEEVLGYSMDLIVRFVRGYIRQYAKDPKGVVELLRINAKWYHDMMESGVLGATQPFEPDFIKACPTQVYGFSADGHVIHAEKLDQIDLDSLIKRIPQDAAMRNRAKQMLVLAEAKDHIARERKQRHYRQISIFDIDGFSLTTHLSGEVKAVLSSIIKQGQENFPETLHQMFILNAPWYFKAGWSIVSVFVDPETKQKIHVCSKDDLYKKHGLPLDQLPEWAWSKDSKDKFKTIKPHPNMYMHYVEVALQRERERHVVPPEPVVPDVATKELAVPDASVVPHASETHSETPVTEGEKSEATGLPIPDATAPPDVDEEEKPSAPVPDATSPPAPSVVADEEKPSVPEVPSKAVADKS